MKYLYILIISLFVSSYSFGCEEAKRDLKYKIITDFENFSLFLLFEHNDRDGAFYISHVVEWMDQYSLSKILIRLEEEFPIYYKELIESKQYVVYRKRCKSN